nr:unnamed protein product [Callosobruchus analis]
MVTLSLVSILLNACCTGPSGVLKGVISHGATPNPASSRRTAGPRFLPITCISVLDQIWAS